MDVSRETPDTTTEPKCYDLTNTIVTRTALPPRIRVSPFAFKRIFELLLVSIAAVPAKGSNLTTPSPPTESCPTKSP